MVDAIKSGRPESADRKSETISAGKNGGRRPGAGRKKGSVGKITKEIRTAAQAHGPRALAVLAGLMDKAESEQAIIAAAKEILDRAYGKSPQAITGEGGGPVKLSVEWLTPAA